MAPMHLVQTLPTRLGLGQESSSCSWSFEQFSNEENSRDDSLNLQKMTLLSVPGELNLVHFSFLLQRMSHRKCKIPVFP